MLQSLFNFSLYTPLELALFNIGCSMWVIVYFIYVKNIYTKRFIEMPLLAAGSNFAWEWVWGIAFHTDMGILPQMIYRAWIFVDLYIIYGVFRYGYKQCTSEDTRKFAPILALASIALFSCIYYFMVVQGFDTSIGANSAYACQLFLSGMYVYLILTKPDLQNFSATAAWLRTYGTGLITIFMLIHYPNNHLLHSMAIASFILDNTYLFLFYRLKKSRSSVGQ